MASQIARTSQFGDYMRTAVFGQIAITAIIGFGAEGIDHMIKILKADLNANLSQVGVSHFSELASRLYSVD